MKLISTITVPKYPRLVTLSNSIRPKYFIKEELKKELILKYCDKAHYKKTKERILSKDYYWREEKVTRNKQRVTRSFLVERLTGEKVIANPKKVGTKKTKVINGQDLIRLHLPAYLFSSIKEVIKRDFRVAIRNSEVKPISQYPLIITCVLYDTVEDALIKSNPNWDVDNRFFIYGKYFLDTLKAEGIIEEDDRLHITQPPSVLFTPIDDENERKMVFSIYLDERPEILNNEYYHKLCQNKNQQKSQIACLLFNRL